VQVTSMHFKSSASLKLRDETLQKNLRTLTLNFVQGRAKGILDFDNFEEIRTAAAAIRDRALENLDAFLLQFEREATARGAQVHWAETREDVNRIVLEIATQHDVKKVIKSKSMVTEECALNEALAQAGIEVVETDMGEYILQLAHEPPSHIVAPVVHKSMDEISELFERAHHRPRKRDPAELTRETRDILRSSFLTADMGITGANFLIAESGSTLIVTNEGNGRMVTTLPRVHVAITGIEKVVPSLEEVNTLLRLLPRSSSGQPITNYVSLSTGTRGKGDKDGPEHFHVVLVDAGRSKLLGTKLQAALRCIRCGACMNHCPVYQSIGGHAYGWVYPGPIGSVLTPAYAGLENALELPQAATLCNACGVVCPVKIPLPDLMRVLREQQFERKLRPSLEYWALKAWGWAVQRPGFYRALSAVGARLLKLLGGREG
jgi:L-lactate dehydrogenase complex protein LldF